MIVAHNEKRDRNVSGSGSFLPSSPPPATKSADFHGKLVLQLSGVSERSGAAGGRAHGSQMDHRGAGRALSGAHPGTRLLLQYQQTDSCAEAVGSETRRPKRRVGEKGSKELVDTREFT